MRLNLLFVFRNICACLLNLRMMGEGKRDSFLQVVVLLCIIVRYFLRIASVFFKNRLRYFKYINKIERSYFKKTRECFLSLEAHLSPVELPYLKHE